MTTISYKVNWNPNTKLGRWTAKVDSLSFFGSKADTTSNRCALEALIQAIETLPVYKDRTYVQVANAGQYLKSGMNNIRAFCATPKHARAYTPTTKVGAELANLDLWKDLIRVGRQHNIKLLVD